LQFHPNSNYLATGSTDKTVRLWAVADAKLVRVFPGHKGAVQALSFSPDGKFIASAGKCPTVVSSCMIDYI
jgi:transcription initiation factor TFIID subunit 5